MRTAASLHLSPSQAAGKALSLLVRFVILMVVYFALFAIGGQIVVSYLPSTTAEPGPVPQMTGLMIACATSVVVIMMMIASSRWHGWKLILTMSVAFYLVMTLVTQLESWYFLYGVTIGTDLMLRLFIQGLPLAFIFIPIAVLVMGRFRHAEGETEYSNRAFMPITEWLWKLGVIYIAYLVLPFVSTWLCVCL